MMWIAHHAFPPCRVQLISPWVFLAAVLMLTVPAEATSPKGLYGQIRPITNHPNLYYNLGEIQELRELILNGTGPQRLINAYHSAASGRMAMVAPDPWSDSMSDGRVVHHNNMEACVEYMLKPTQAKADKMREAILSFLSALPDGMNGGVADGDNGMSVPWMYDLVMGFHPDTFSSSDRSTMLAWFDKNAKFSQNKGRDHSDASFSEENIRTYEGRRLLWYPNWYAMQMVSGLNFALLTGNQADLDFWADSGYPHELFDDTGITPTYPPQTTNRIDLIKHIKAIFDSGANFDTYERDQWDGISFYSPYNFNDFGYHVYQANPVMLAAEAAYHNGMTGVFNIKPASGGKPLIQRYHEFTVNARGALNRRFATEYLMPYSPIVSYGLRRYGSSTIVDGAQASNLNIGYSNGVENHPELVVIFGYPHGVPVPAPPPILTPVPGTTLRSSTVTFVGGQTIEDLEYWLYVGSTVGNSDLYDSGSLGTISNTMVTGLPTGGTIHVRYRTRNSSGWSFQDHQYFMNLSGTNQDPVAVDDSYNMPANTSLTVIAAIGVLDNDSDPDGDPFTATPINSPTPNGTLILNADGSFDYTPNLDFTGDDTFDYEVTDGLGGSDQVTVTITVTPAPNQPPIVDAGANQSITLPTLAMLDGTVTDDGLPIPTGAVTTTWSMMSGPGTVTFGDAGAVATTASFSAGGTYVLRLTADDGALSSFDDMTIIVVAAGNMAIDVQVASSTDDVEELISDGFMYLDSSDLELGADGGDPQVVGLRFTQVAVPANATITLAHITFTVDEANTVATTAEIVGEAAADAAPFTSATNNLTTRPTTSASVTWDGIPPWTETGTNQTPNLAAIVQEIVNGGGGSGQPMVFLITATGERTAVSYDGAPLAAPILHVEYQVSMAVNQGPTVDAGLDQTIMFPNAATLDGTVTDDGLPVSPGSLTTEWTQESGPGVVTFGNINAVDTTASFSTAGTYVLRLTAADGESTTLDELTITVSDGSIFPPPILTPVQGTTLTSSPVPLDWSAGTGVDEYWLGVGTSLASVASSPHGDIFAQSTGTTTSQVVTVPLTGNPVFVRLWWRIGATWLFTDYTYDTQAGGTAGVSIVESGGTTAVTEGSPGVMDTYTVVLTNLPTDTVVVTVTSTNEVTGVTVDAASLTFGPGTWETPQAVTVTAVEDAMVEGAHATVITHDIDQGFTLDPNYAALQGTLSPVTANITDNDNAGTPDITSPTPGSTLLSTSVPLDWSAGTGVDEYWLGVGTSLASVASSPHGDIFAQSTGTTTSQVVTVPLTGNPVFVRLWWRIGATWLFTDYTYDTQAGGTAGVSIVESGGTTAVTEGSPGVMDTYTVVLTNLPTDTVVVTVTSTNEVTGVTVDAASLTFGPGTWETPQAVTVTAVEDAMVEGAHATVITHDIDQGFTLDPNYTALQGTLSPVTANITDNDSAGVSIVESGGTTDVTEGTPGITDDYTVVLSNLPTDTVVVTVTSTDVVAGVTVDAATLTFTPGTWETPQPVTVTAVDDALVEGTLTTAINHDIDTGLTLDPAYDGLAGTLSSITATITDNDSAGTPALTSPPLASPLTSSLETFVWSAGTGVDEYWLGVGTSQAALANDPFGDIFSGSTGLTTSQVVSGIPITGSQVFVRLWYRTGATWLFTNYIYDTQGVAGVSIVESAGTTDVTEGTPGITDDYTVVLTNLPTDTVVVTVTSTDVVAGVTVDAATLTFGPGTWETPQPVTVTAVDDALVEGTLTTAINHDIDTGLTLDPAYDGLAGTLSSITATITDNDSAGPPALTSPPLASPLTSSLETFVWSAGTGVDEYWLGVGTSQAALANDPFGDIFSGSTGLTTSQVVTVPLTGNPVFVRLWWRIGATWLFTDYTYQTQTP